MVALGHSYRLTRRGIASQAAAATISALLTACGSGATSRSGAVPEGPKAISGKLTWVVRTQAVEQQWQQTVVIPTMKERFPQLQIEWEAANVNEKVITGFAAGDPPDVFNGPGLMMQLYAERKLMNLSPLITRDKFDVKAFGGFEKDGDMCRSGKQWGLPILTTLGTTLFYSVQAMEQTGVPMPSTNWKDKTWTWDRVLDIAKKTTRNWGQAANDAYYGLLSTTWRAVHIMNWAYPWGGDPWRNDMRTHGIAKDCNWTDRTVMEGLQWLQDLVTRHQVLPREGAPTRPFAQGGAAMWLERGWSASDLRTAPFRWSMAPNPWKVKNHAVVHNDSIHIASLSKNPDAAWELIKYLASQDGQKDYAKSTGRPPTRVDAFDPWLDQIMALPGASFKSKEALREVATGFLADYENSEDHWIVSVGTLAPLLNEVTTKLLTGEGSAQTILTAAKPRADAILLDIYNQYKDSSPLLQDTLCS